MKKYKSDNKFLFFLSLGLNIAYLINIIVFDYEFTSTDDINNIATPIVAVIALYYAHKSWDESRSQSRYESTKTKIDRVFNSITNIELKYHEGDDLMILKFNEFSNKLGYIYNKLEKLKYDEFTNSNSFEIESYFKKFDKLNYNFNEYFQNEKIEHELLNLNSIINHIHKSNLLNKNHKEQLLEYIKEIYQKTFRRYILLVNCDIKAVFITQDEEFILKELRNFDLVKYINKVYYNINIP